MQSRNQPYEPAFDHIRAFAALLILGYHSFQHMSGFMAHGSGFQESDRVLTHNPLFSLILEGHTAVGLFIVLSGFLFARSAIGKDINYRNFVRNRVLRIYPLYLLLVVVELAINPQVSLQTLVMIILPTGYIPAVQAMGGVGSLFWAVGVEFQFYLIFPFLMRILETRGFRPLIALIGLAILIRYGSTYQGANIRDISYWTSVGRIDQFVIGMLAAKACADRPALAARLSWLFLPAVVLVLAVMYGFHWLGSWPSISPWKGVWPTVEGLLWATFICTYIPVAKQMPRLLSKGLSSIGEISYSTYLLHVSIIVVIGANGWFLRPTGVLKFDVLITSLLVVFPIVLSIAALSYYAVEKAFLGMRVRYTTPREQPATNPAIP
jgi:peptidoglycan/LPS O-acetylase OafA/YrhL